MYKESAKLIFKLLSDRNARLILAGYRPEVICLVQGTAERKKYLLVVPERDHSVWIPPQEGIEVKQTIADAALRGLKVELGFNENQLHFRKSGWIAKRRLPAERQGERDLPGSLRGWFGGVSMLGKGYYAALIIADEAVAIRPNRAEIYKWEWVDAEEFHKRIETNLPDKLEIIRSAWRRLLG